MPRYDSIFTGAVASLLEVQVGHAFGVSTYLYRFSRSHRVLLYKLIVVKDRRRALFSVASKS
jgi:hypothetical protein